jgi:hypothetical protein
VPGEKPPKKRDSKKVKLMKKAVVKHRNLKIKLQKSIRHTKKRIVKLKKIQKKRVLTKKEHKQLKHLQKKHTQLKGKHAKIVKK